MDDQKVRKLYGRLKGIKDAVDTPSTVLVSSFMFADYNSIVSDLAQVLGENLDAFILHESLLSRYENRQVHVRDIRERLYQLIAFLEHGYNIGQKIIEIGSIYNSIIDAELKSRCSDILSAPANFDRVINQATQILEDRIRKKGKQHSSLSAVPLVTKVFNPDPKKSVLRASDNAEEHEGFHYVCKGIMLAFRNPTHHQISDTFTREEALKVCAFIDNLLQIVEKSKTV